MFSETLALEQPGPALESRATVAHSGTQDKPACPGWGGAASRIMPTRIYPQDGRRGMEQQGATGKRRIMFYADSLTWGWVPVENAVPTRRYPYEQRLAG